ncbi:MAG: hypothetical protein ACLR43_04820 [Faecalibacillus faecis]
MSSEIMSLEMDVLFIIIDSILYQMYINREQNDHWNYFYLYHCLGLCLFVYGCNLDRECKTSSYF